MNINETKLAAVVDAALVTVVLQKIFWPQLVVLDSLRLPQYLVCAEIFCNTTTCSASAVSSRAMSLTAGVINKLCAPKGDK